ncbi:MAG: DUF3108 domain-containing protein [Bacteroidota bacterium]
MPLLLVFAFAGSVALHAAALFGTDIELLGSDPEPVPLQAELRPPPPAAPAPKPVVRKPEKAVKTTRPHHAARPATPVSELPPAAVEPQPAAPDQAPVAQPEKPEPPAAPPVAPLLPASGAIRFVIYHEALGMPIGRAEHRWEFTDDGHYRLSNVTETSGLIAMFKPIRMQVESRGRLVAGGLQPEHYQTWKNGQDNNESADFDWTRSEVHLARDGSVRPVEPGAQDLLSLTYQLGYLPHPEQGGSLGVVTAKRYQHYKLDALGEEDLDLPAGHFHTLHLRATTETTTEIWIALDLHRLPVKIRFTDKKGDSFLQIATEIGMPVQPASP